MVINTVDNTVGKFIENYFNEAIKYEEITSNQIAPNSNINALAFNPSKAVDKMAQISGYIKADARELSKRIITDVAENSISHKAARLLEIAAGAIDTKLAEGKETRNGNRLSARISFNSDDFITKLNEHLEKTAPDIGDQLKEGIKRGAETLDNQALYATYRNKPYVSPRAQPGEQTSMKFTDNLGERGGFGKGV